MTIKQLRERGEDLAAESVVKAAALVGVDAYGDVFEQGRAQAYREIAKLIAVSGLENAPR